jgi:hypothetical protein
MFRVKKLAADAMCYLQGRFATILHEIKGLHAKRPLVHSLFSKYLLLSEGDMYRVWQGGVMVFRKLIHGYFLTNIKFQCF